LDQLEIFEEKRRKDMKIGKTASVTFLCFVAAVLALHALDSSAQVPAETEALLRAIFDQGEFNAKSFQATWLRDGSSYLVLEAVPGANVSALVRYDAASGKRTVLASPSQLVPSGATEPLAIQSYELSSDGGRLLLQTGRGGRRADYWVLERKSGKLRQLVDGVRESADWIIARASSAALEGQRFIYSDQENLYVYDLRRDQVIALTKDGVVGSVSNGGAVWSPDGKRIAYVQSDASSCGLRSVLIPSDPTYPEVRQVRFARVGGPIPTLRVGVVDAEGGKTSWLSIPAPAEGFYFGQVSWAGNSHELLVEKLSRFRDEREFLIVDVRTRAVTRIYHESDPAWVVSSREDNIGLEWISGGRAFLVLSEKDGWRHAYIISREGEEQALLTPGASDIIKRSVVDEAGGWFYCLASPDNATQQYLYRVRLDGTGEPERVTPADQPGTHDYDISPDAKWAFHTYSTFDIPPVTELVQLPEHRAVRVLEDNSELREKMAPLIHRPAEFLQLDIGDGVELDAWMIKPRDFDPSRKYPVFVYVYTEPDHQTVLDGLPPKYSFLHHSFHYVIADLGYLVVSIDTRGTPAPKGAAWRRAVFGSLGPLSTEEHAAGLQELGRIRPYVDLSRVGIWGHSGGGSNTLNSMFRKPDVYHVGIAVAPKPQPHLYNAWFQEIYMNTPEVNPEGYRLSAPINFAEGLKGDLLIIHGTGEGNTHLEITEGLVDRLIELGKSFDYTTYPYRGHNFVEGKGTRLHLRMLMVRYLLTHLPPGPRL
jgi:dipeptidyl-peptidase-4